MVRVRRDDVRLCVVCASRVCCPNTVLTLYYYCLVSFSLSGTRSFPHPMSGLSYLRGDTPANFVSYGAFESLTTTSFGPGINSWRRHSLRLPRMTVGSGVAGAIPKCKIPFSAMWSPSFVPKPDDWPEQCRVVGTFTQDKKKAGVVDEEKFADLIAWLKAGEKPVFIGFGSMVIKDTSTLETMIMKAARQANCRIVVQSSWSKLDVSDEELCQNVGPVAHDWLLPLCCAVVHHGELLHRGASFAGVALLL